MLLQLVLLLLRLLLATLLLEGVLLVAAGGVLRNEGMGRAVGAGVYGGPPTVSFLLALPDTGGLRKLGIGTFCGDGVAWNAPPAYALS